MEASTPRSGPCKANTPNSWGWLSIPIIFVALILYFYATDSIEVYEQTNLAFLCGLVFTALSSFLIAFLAGRSFLYEGTPTLLMLTCGALILGSGTLISNTLESINSRVALHNICVWVSALCHLAGVAIKPNNPKTMSTAAGMWLGLGCGISIFFVWITTIAITEDLVPPFFIQGQGGTLLRQVVLISAIGMFLTAAAFLKGPKPKSSGFNHWYAMALCLIAIGLFGVLLQHSMASLIGWTGRIAQYLGGVFMLVAAVVSVRESRAWRLTIETSLRESEQRLSLALSAGRIATWEWRLTTDEVIWNDEHFLMLGYKLGEVNPSYQTWVEHVHPDDRPATETLFAKALTKGGSYVARFRVLWPDGTIHWIEARGHSEHNAAGQPVRSYGVMIDVTERKQAEEALRQKAVELAEAQRLARIGSWCWDAKTDVTTGSYELLRIYGYDPATQSIPNFKEQRGVWYPVEEWERLNAAVQESVQRGDGYSLDVQALRNGNRIWISTSCEVVRDLEGKVIGLRGTVQDIDERKRVDEELRRLNENLEQIVQERTAKLRRLASELTLVEQRERKKLSTILHDGLQQYLVAAKMQLNGLMPEVVEKRLRQSITEIEQLLGEAVQVSRSLAAELSPPILRDAGILAGLEWLSRWMLEKHRLKVQLIMEMDEPPALEEDVKVLLFESVRELLLNTVKHSNSRSARIHLFQSQGDQLGLTVSDDGKGFEPEASNAMLSETGFGLFSIQERLSVIGGTFKIASSPGKGCCITLTAPHGPKPLNNSQAASAETQHESYPSTGVSPGKVRILIVDDHVVMREGLARLLAQEPDFEVIGQAADGRQAIEKAASLHPALILMDISMPVLDGIVATRIIHQQHPHIHIIGLSLYTEDERAREMLTAGASFYMSKSGPPSELKAAIRSCCGETRPIVDSSSNSWAGMSQPAL